MYRRLTTLILFDNLITNFNKSEIRFPISYSYILIATAIIRYQRL